MGTGKIRINHNLDASKLLGNNVASTAPAIGLPIETLPFFAISYAIGNVLASFAEPEYIFDTISLPPQNCNAAQEIYRGLVNEAGGFGVKVIGGHTGCYEGLQLPLINVTAFGRVIRPQIKPSGNDSIILAGEPLLEAQWLRWLAGLSDAEVEWRRLTPVPILKDMLKMGEIKLAHDVSEGGIGGALEELQEKYGLNIRLMSKRPLSELSEPSYGTVLAVTDDAQGACRKLAELGHKCEIIGEFGGSEPFQIPNKSPTWEIYGMPASTFDRKLNRFSLFIKQLSRIDLKALVPEVGMNIAYADNASDINDIIGIDGRIVKGMNCVRFGRPAYGASRHIGYILLELKRLGTGYRVAFNIRLSDKAVEILRKEGLNVKEVNFEDSYCPTLRMIKETGIIADAYIERPSTGMEGGIVVLVNDLDRAIELIKKLCA